MKYSEVIMAFLDSTNEALAIIQIQRILRDLELLENEYSSVPVSGVFEDETRQALMEFQSRYSLEANGIVDYETWSLLHLIHHQTRFERLGVRRVQLIPKSRDVEILPGDKNDIIYVIQYMLSQISTKHDEFGEISFTGVYDEITENAVREFKRKNLFDDTGVIDSATLEALFEEYESVILERG